jgi:hypothetical protein
MSYTLAGILSEQFAAAASRDTEVVGSAIPW